MSRPVSALAIAIFRCVSAPIDSDFFRNDFTHLNQKAKIVLDQQANIGLPSELLDQCQQYHSQNSQ